MRRIGSSAPSMFVRRLQAALIPLRPSVAVLALVMALAALWSGAALANLQQAPNSRVVIELPPDYQPAPLFSGFQNERKGVSFVVLEVPHAAYPEIVAGFSSGELEKRGIVEARPGELRRSDPHVYMRGRQASAAGLYEKFFVVFRTSDQTVLVTANVPATAIQSGEVTVAMIEDALASARTVGQPAVRELYRLGFLGDFQEAGRIVGTSKVYTRDGRMEPERPGEARAVFMVAPSLDKRQILEPRTFASQLLTTLSGYTEIKAEAPGEIEIGGLKGHVVRGSAIEQASRQPMRLLQVLLLAPGGGYFRLLGLAPEAEADKLMPQFLEIARSFELAESPGKAP